MTRGAVGAGLGAECGCVARVDHVLDVACGLERRHGTPADGSDTE